MLWDNLAWILNPSGTQSCQASRPTALNLTRTTNISTVILLRASRPSSLHSLRIPRRRLIPRLNGKDVELYGEIRLKKANM